MDERIARIETYGIPTLKKEKKKDKKHRHAHSNTHTHSHRKNKCSNVWEKNNHKKGELYS